MNDSVVLFQDSIQEIVDDYTKVLGDSQRSSIKGMFKYMLQNLGGENALVIESLERFIPSSAIVTLPSFNDQPDLIFCKLLEQLHLTESNVLLIEVITNKIMLEQDLGFIHIPHECFEAYGEFRITARLVNNGFYNGMRKYLTDNFIHRKDGIHS